MLSQLKELIPGAGHWPRFVHNRSQQFEARLTQVEILRSASIFLQGMQDSVLPIPVAHGQGRVVVENESELHQWLAQGLAVMRFVDQNHQTAATYPANPNGSAGGVTGFTTDNGRFTIMMPHPERVFRTLQHSWHPGSWGDDGPWFRIFQNARRWVD